MPRFFFDVREGPLFTEDVEGTDLAGRHVLIAEARRLLIDIARDLKLGDGDFRIEITVRDSAGLPIHFNAMQLELKWLDEI